jgi:hypothetical protein
MLKWQMVVCGVLACSGIGTAGPMPPGFTVQALEVSYLPGWTNIGTIGISPDGTQLFFTPDAAPPAGYVPPDSDAAWSWSKWNWDNMNRIISRMTATVRVTDTATGESDTVAITGEILAGWFTEQTQWYPWLTPRPTGVHESAIWPNTDGQSRSIVTLGGIDHEVRLGRDYWWYELSEATGGDPTVSAGFEVEAVPEPASLTLLALGGVSVFVARRRKASATACFS